MSKHILTWLGHGTFLLQHSTGVNIIFDPWVDENPSFPVGFNLPKIDLILVSHGHFDHISSTPKLCKKQSPQPQVIGIFELCNWLERKGVDNCIAMNKGGTITEHGLEITMVHADHSCGISEDDGSITYGGEAVGFVIKLDSENTMYFSGDTNVFESMKLIHELYNPNIAILPIGDRFTMGPMEVGKAIELLKVTTLIPMHFGTFPDLTGTPELLTKSLRNHDINIKVPTPGKNIEI